MAYEQPGFLISLQTGADLSASTNQFTFVKLDANGHIVAIAAATDIPVGVLQDTPGNGDVGSVMVMGITKLQGSGALTDGNQIGTSAAGQAVAVVGGTDTTKYAVGQVLENNSAAGGYATCLINCANPHRAS